MIDPLDGGIVIPHFGKRDLDETPLTPAEEAQVEARLADPANWQLLKDAIAACDPATDVVLDINHVVVYPWDGYAE